MFPNDLTFDKRGNLYVTDAAGGAVWRIRPNGSVELWADHPLLQGTGDLGLGFPYGANGIAFSHGRVIVANTERGMLVAIPIEPAGDAGEPTVLAESRALIGVDGIALDVRGNVYAAVNGQNTLVAARIDGSIDVLATAADGLNQPSTVTFGTGMRDHQTLFFVILRCVLPAPTPGVLKMKAGVPGQPLPRTLKDAWPKPVCEMGTHLGHGGGDASPDRSLFACCTRRRCGCSPIRCTGRGFESRRSPSTRDVASQ